MPHRSAPNRLDREGLAIPIPVARGAGIYREIITHGQTGTLMPADFRSLQRSFAQGIVPLLIGWRRGAHKLTALLARPIQTLIILEP
jgi:hypothetical protein